MQEIFAAEELQGKFSLERITKSAAVFDKTKLSWMNGQYLRALPDEEVRMPNLRLNQPCSWQGRSKSLQVSLTNISKFCTADGATHVLLLRAIRVYCIL